MAYLYHAYVFNANEQWTPKCFLKWTWPGKQYHKWPLCFISLTDPSGLDSWACRLSLFADIFSNIAVNLALWVALSRAGCSWGHWSRPRTLPWKQPYSCLVRHLCSFGSWFSTLGLYVHMASERTIMSSLFFLGVLPHLSFLSHAERAPVSSKYLLFLLTAL